MQIIAMADPATNNKNYYSEVNTECRYIEWLLQYKIPTIIRVSLIRFHENLKYYNFNDLI